MMKEEAEEPSAVDSDYSGRPLEELTLEEVRASLARGEGLPREDRLIMVDEEDGTERDALTGEVLSSPPPTQRIRADVIGSGSAHHTHVSGRPSFLNSIIPSGPLSPPATVSSSRSLSLLSGGSTRCAVVSLSS